MYQNHEMSPNNAVFITDDTDYDELVQDTWEQLDIVEAINHYTDDPKIPQDTYGNNYDDKIDDVIPKITYHCMINTLE